MGGKVVNKYVRGRPNIGGSVRHQGRCLLMIGSGIDPTIDLQMFHGGYSAVRHWPAADETL